MQLFVDLLFCRPNWKRKPRLKEESLIKKSAKLWDPQVLSPPTKMSEAE